MPVGPENQASCTFEHRLFTVLGDAYFRKAETDGAPVLVTSLGEREAALPFRSLRDAFGIQDDTPDARMLDLVAAALDFVSSLRPGDPLPAEVLSGEASWEPAARHREIASTRLQLQLVTWLDPEEAGAFAPSDGDALLRLAGDPALRQRVQDAIGRAAVELGLAGGEEVLRQFETVAGELSYIEALRERLLRRVEQMAGKVRQMMRHPRGPGAQTETLLQVDRLVGIGLRQIAARFDEVDAQTGEVLSALRNAANHCAYMRRHRDWLYRSQRAWTPVLDEWARVAPALDDMITPLLARAYQFLAPRFMPQTEWRAASRAAPEQRARRMVW